MAKSIPAIINPDLLAWARRTAGYESAEAAEKLKVSVDEYDGWEGGAPLSMTTLRAAARLFKRPLAVFFLPAPPRDMPPLRDNRKPHGAAVAASSPELLADIRIARSRRATALDLAAELAADLPVFGIAIDNKEDAETAASRIRRALQIPGVNERVWKTTTEALDNWRRAVERQGVLAFQAENLNRNEARGFSIYESPLPIIVMASGDRPAGRLFTMLHELTHLGLHQGGICDLEDKDAVEQFCNRVAGAALVPREEIEAKLGVAGTGRRSDWTDEELETLASLFRVSEETILRRLLILGHTTQEFYQRKRAEYLGRYTNMKQFGRAEFPVKKARALGGLYTSVVFDAYHREAITLADVSDYLDAKLKWIPEIERIVLGSTA